LLRSRLLSLCFVALPAGNKMYMAHELGHNMVRTAAAQLLVSARA
jgi:hypothetical protein